MNRIFLKRAGLVALLVGTAGLAVATPSEARPSRPRARGFQLFSASTLGMEVNRVYCGLRAIGETCVDITGSPVLGGGSWPRGSGDAYIFNSGLQIAGIIPASAGFAWAGDTVGTWFMDPRGDQQSGEQLTDIFSSLNAADLAAWPSAATIRDTALYNIALIGRQTIAQQDIWWRYWDGNPNQTNGRGHPAGIMVEQRGLGWNFPSGNEDLIYFIYRFINITSSDASKYAGLSAAGYTASEIADIAAVGARFQQLNEAKFGVAIPDTGYSIQQTFAAFFMDPDVGDFLTNYSTAFLPFAMSAAYVGDWDEPTWQFPSSIFSPPFAVAPGFVGVKYLKSPIDPNTQQEFGISMFTNTSNGNPFPDAVGIEQMYRYLSGTVSPALGDNSCTYQGGGTPQQRHLCALVQQQTDTRFLMSSGPFQLDPGQSSVIVVAYLFAAPLAAPVAPFIGLDLPPGTPPSGTRLVSGQDTLRVVDRIAGWVSHNDANADLDITQNEVTVVDRSLLQKSLVAQAVFNNRFLLPFAPEAPEFYVIPGDNQVTIAWQQSPSETTGDPYFAVASAPTLPPAQGGGPNPLFDPNYRFNDVEGYRIWRGRTTSQMEVIAQFDYANTSFNDVSGTVVNTDYGTQCAPELGLTTSCPTFPNPVPIVTQAGTQPGLVQIPPGGRVVAAGNVVITQADTAVSGGVKCGNDPCPNLTDNGVPFAFVDNTVRNGFRYFYAVTAFDVNSVKSTGVGNTSLESPLVTRQVTPRALSSNAQSAVLIQGTFGGDGTQLDPSLPYPALDTATGTLRGPIPPSNAAALGFLASVAEALPPGDYVARVDSVSPGFTGGFGTHPFLFVSFIAGADTFPASFDINPPNFNAAVTTANEFSGSLPLVPFDTARARLVGIPQAFAAAGRMPVAFSGHSVPLSATGSAISLANGRYGASGTDAGARYLAHSYWYDEGGSPPADPTMNPFVHASNNSGALTGVTRIFTPKTYRVPLTTISANFRGFQAASAGSWYPADIIVTWGAGGTVTVRDSTHRTNLPYMAGVQPGYGFLDLAALVAAGVTATGGSGATSVDDGVGSSSMAALSYHHLYAINPVCGNDWWAIPTVCTPLAATASLQPLDFNFDGTQDGTGIVMLINGEAFFMEMASLPAAGTRWHLAAWGGGSLAVTCSPGLPVTAAPTDCRGYAHTAPQTRPAWAPGLQVGIRVQSGFSIAAASGDLSGIHTVPDPYYVTNALEITSSTKILRFVNLPNQAIIRIYSASGVLVNIVSHNDASGGGAATWNLRNRNNQFVASGVYFYHVETPDGREKIGRFTVVNFAQ